MTTFRATYRRHPNGPLITSTVTLPWITAETDLLTVEVDVCTVLGIAEHHLYVPLVRKCTAIAHITGQPCQRYLDVTTPYCQTHRHHTEGALL